MFNDFESNISEVAFIIMCALFGFGVATSIAFFAGWLTPLLH